MHKYQSKLRVIWQALLQINVASKSRMCNFYKLKSFPFRSEVFLKEVALKITQFLIIVSLISHEKRSVLTVVRKI